MIRELSLEETQNGYGALLDQAFGLPGQSHFFDDFPIWAAESECGVSRLGLFEDAQLISAASLRVASLNLKGGSLPIGVIGGVATLPSHQGKGHSRRVMSETMAVARRKGIAMIFLWGNQHRFYRSFGFELCGLQQQIPVSKLKLSTPDQPIGRGWRPDLFECLQKNRIWGFKLEDRDVSWVSCHKNVEWFWREESGKIVAYCGLGRGIDLPNLIHEWGGEIEALKGIFANILSERPDVGFLGNPRVFGEAGFDVDLKMGDLEYLTMANLMQPEKVLRAFGEKDIKVGVSGENWKVQFGSGNSVELTRLELSKLFWGPEMICPQEKAPFPLPLWIWGLDSA